MALPLTCIHLSRGEKYEGVGADVALGDQVVETAATAFVGSPEEVAEREK